LTIEQATWRQRQLTDVFLASYFLASVSLRTLEGLIGPSAMFTGLRHYVRDNRYSHPGPRDLQAALERAAGEDLGWFFDGAMRDGHRPDWAVLAVRQDAVGAPRGMTWTDGSWRDADPEEEDGDGSGDDAPWTVTVEIGRRGDLAGPVEVELTWDDGSTERRVWDGRDRWVRWVEVSPRRLAGVAVDPDGVWALETRRADNYWRDQPRDFGPLWWLGAGLQVVGLPTVPWS
jgi:hypothetical protein